MSFKNANLLWMAALFIGAFVFGLAVSALWGMWGAAGFLVAGVALFKPLSGVLWMAEESVFRWTCREVRVKSDQEA